MAHFLLSVWHDEEYELGFTTPEARGSAPRWKR